uniref:Uncharacterized protein n=1 Tax=Hyaloperonospora arabidopsidis (strain Emoy2) TaxID=559515 RepID=M4BCA2_HYAAE
MGEEIPVDDCVACPDGGYQEYRLTVMHFAADKEVDMVVRKTGGDLCQLDSNALQFRSSMLLECTVCFGDMEITALGFST